jgi:hypothetical protein
LTVFFSWWGIVLHIADSECWRQSEGRLWLWNCIGRYVVVKQICEVLRSRPVSGLRARSTECMSTELSIESDSWNSGDVFCVHYCFILSVVPINTVICYTLGLSVTINKTENSHLNFFSQKCFKCVYCVQN